MKLSINLDAGWLKEHGIWRLAGSLAAIMVGASIVLNTAPSALLATVLGPFDVTIPAWLSTVLSTEQVKLAWLTATTDLPAFTLLGLPGLALLGLIAVGRDGPDVKTVHQRVERQFRSAWGATFWLLMLLPVQAGLFEFNDAGVSEPWADLRTHLIGMVVFMLLAVVCYVIVRIAGLEKSVTWLLVLGSLLLVVGLALVHLPLAIWRAVSPAKRTSPAARPV